MKKKQNNNFSYDEQSDVLYFGVKNGMEEEYVEIAPGINVELDDNHQVIGVEVLNASRVLKPLTKSFRLKSSVNS